MDERPNLIFAIVVWQKRNAPHKSPICTPLSFRHLFFVILLYFSLQHMLILLLEMNENKLKNEAEEEREEEGEAKVLKSSPQPKEAILDFMANQVCNLCWYLLCSTTYRIFLII